MWIQPTAVVNRIVVGVNESTVMLTSSRRPDRQCRKCTSGDAGDVLPPARAAIFLGCTTRRRNLAEARREHLPRRDVVVTRPRNDTTASVSVFVFGSLRFGSVRFRSAREAISHGFCRMLLATSRDYDEVRLIASCVDQTTVILITIIDVLVAEQMAYD